MTWGKNCSHSWTFRLLYKMCFYHPMLIKSKAQDFQKSNHPYIFDQFHFRTNSNVFKLRLQQSSFVLRLCDKEWLQKSFHNLKLFRFLFEDLEFLQLPFSNSRRDAFLPSICHAVIFSKNLSTRVAQATLNALMFLRHPNSFRLAQTVSVSHGYQSFGKVTKLRSENKDGERFLGHSFRNEVVLEIGAFELCFLFWSCLRFLRAMLTWGKYKNRTT